MTTKKATAGKGPVGKSTPVKAPSDLVQVKKLWTGDRFLLGNDKFHFVRVAEDGSIRAMRLTTSKIQTSRDPDVWSDHEYGVEIREISADTLVKKL